MKFSFKHKIIFGFLLIAVLLLFVGYFAFLTTKNLQKVSNAILKENVSSLRAAQELELALLNQKGFVSSYFLDGNPVWLEILEGKKRDFETWFKNAQNVALTSREDEILEKIFALYTIYDNQRNEAIRLYEAGNTSEAKQLLLVDMKKSIDALYLECENLIAINEALIQDAEAASRKRAAMMTGLIWVTIITTLFLGSLMGFFIAHRVNEQLIRSAKMASLGQLSANIAHEIRNPLTAIKMRLYSLTRELTNIPYAGEDLGIIREEIDRIEKTVKNCLDFARPPEPNFQRCDVNKILEGTINLVSSKAESQHIRIIKRFNATPAQTEADGEQMRQVFFNLILNAIEAMPDGGDLDLSIEKREDKRMQSIIEIRIADTGPGLPVNFKRRIFEPFFTTKTEGTGLGLFIASRIIHMHKGAIEAESQPGHGTVFAVKLPVIS
ncbi:MCP four helix bundle domain-containing protein [bacterium]|nr:MCP four helix bundle domain-containing protein [bacterium]